MTNKTHDMITQIKRLITYIITPLYEYLYKAHSQEYYEF